MRSSLADAALAAVLAASTVFASPALAQGFVTEREEWATEVVRRPLTLAPQQWELTVPVGINLSDGAEGEPVFLNPSFKVGITDRLTVGIRHFLGVCLNEEEEGCPEPYNDLSGELIFSLARSAGLEVAGAVALNLAPIVDDLAVAGEARLMFRTGGEVAALTIAPTLNFGVNDREEGPKRFGVGTNFGTYDVLVPQNALENKEWLLVPATLQIQLGPTFAVAVSAAVNGPLNPEVGDYADYWTVPVAAAAVLTPVRSLDIGAALTFPRLLGEDDDADERLISAFIALRR
ncbi:MAG TPA: hypothetical protein VD838_22565 [Anaeromyxobacteraceae bacterium]|nr:hypothetical protein [Anaeromyxobacteraceae bacterium]